MTSILSALPTFCPVIFWICFALTTKKSSNILWPSPFPPFTPLLPQHRATTSLVWEHFWSYEFLWYLWLCDVLNFFIAVTTKKSSNILWTPLHQYCHNIGPPPVKRGHTFGVLSLHLIEWSFEFVCTYHKENHQKSSDHNFFPHLRHYCRNIGPPPA